MFELLLVCGGCVLVLSLVYGAWRKVPNTDPYYV